MLAPQIRVPDSFPFHIDEIRVIQPCALFCESHHEIEIGIHGGIAEKVTFRSMCPESFHRFDQTLLGLVESALQRYL